MSEDIRRSIIKKNRLLVSDTYNRTMDYTSWCENDGEATYTLTFRGGNNKDIVYDYFVVDGVRELINTYFKHPISQNELDFAQEFFEEQWKIGWVGYFNYQRRNNIIKENNGYLPLTIHSFLDGSIIKPGEPVLTISGPREIIARFEPKILSIFYPSITATHAHIIEELGLEWRMIDYSNRSAINQDMHFSGVRANYIGMGLEKTSHDATSAVYPHIKTSGTLAHRYFASYDTEDEAMENAVLKNNPCILLCDYVDSISGLKKIIQLKKKYPNNTIFPRLDSGDIIHQIIFYLTELTKQGMLSDSDKVIVSEVKSIQQLFEIESKIRESWFDPVKHLLYGAGWVLLAWRKTRDELSAVFKQTMYNGCPTGKMSDDIIKSPIPGEPCVIVNNGNRIIAQRSEVETKTIVWEALHKTLYNKWKLWYSDNDFQEIEDARKRLKKESKWITSLKSAPLHLSELTNEYKRKVHQSLLGMKI